MAIHNENTYLQLRLATRIARLYHEQGRTQPEIASLLNIFLFKSGITALAISGLGVLIFAGLKLLGLHPEKKNRDDELPPYPHE